MRHLSLFLLIILCCSGARAYSVTCSPGQLESLVEDAANVESLTVEGSMNAADFKFIAEQMPSLQSLDLAGATIEATDDVIINGSRSFKSATIPAFVFAGHGLRHIVLPAGGVTLDDGVFAGSGLEEITIGANDTMGAGAFVGCKSLTEATVGCATVPVGAFAGCTALRNVNLTAPSVSLGAEAFAACALLGSVEGSQNITATGAGAFKDCSILNTLETGKGLTDLGAYTFAGTAITHLDLGTLSAIGPWALAGMENLATLDARSVVALGEGCLMGCTALTELTLGELNSVADFAMAFDSSLASLDMGAASTLGAYALSHAASLAEIQLPEQLTAVGDNAMEYTRSLTRIVCDAVEVPATGTDVWLGITPGDIDLWVPEESVNAYSNAAQWQEFNVTTANAGTPATVVDLASRITAAVSDGVLTVRAIGTTAVRIDIYSAAGVLLDTCAPHAAEARISVAGISGYLIIVAVTTDEGNTITFKLSLKH